MGKTTMRKTGIFGLLTLGLGLALLALLAYSGESVHTTRTGDRARTQSVSAPADHEGGPTIHRNGLMLSH
ncbi:MAG TPA: hypothetical protein VIF59_11390 [Methylomirabilota bacterium]|jgi:hypothetical protein